MLGGAGWRLGSHPGVEREPRGGKARPKGSGADGERRLLVRQVQGWVGGAAGAAPPQVLCREPGLLPSPPLRLNRLGPGPFILLARLCHKLGPKGPDSGDFPKVAGSCLWNAAGLERGSKPRSGAEDVEADSWSGLLWAVALLT